MSSSNQMVDDNTSDDLMTKYQRLAAKYSKMRAQIQVLKTAFTDEQSKSAQMKDNIVERDQSVRRLKQEMESLDFRNQQLAKRVAVLQDELLQQQQQHKQNKSKIFGRNHSSAHSTPAHHLNGDAGGQPDNSLVFDVINGELQSKISENEQLHLQLASIESDYRQRMADIEHQLAESRDRIGQLDHVMADTEHTKQKAIIELKDEKRSLETQLTACRNELADTRAQSRTFESENKEIKERIQKIEEMTQNHQEVRDNLQKQLSICESKLTASEQLAEHWMLESQLMQLKLNKTLAATGTPVVADTTDLVGGSPPVITSDVFVTQQTFVNNGSIAGVAAAKMPTSSSTPSTSSQRSIEMSCNDFAGSSLQSPTVSEDKLSLNSNNTGTTGDEDMPQVTAYLRGRIAQLIDSLHSADSKAVAYQTECHALQQRVVTCGRQRQQCAQDMTDQSDQIAHLREELATNVSNYEQQLSLMSEHLANMNDKLTAQTDEIESLKHFQRNSSSATAAANNSSIKGKNFLGVKNK